MESNHQTTKPNAPGRRRSGLTRSFSAWAAFLFGVHCISLSSSGFIPFSWVASVWPGASIVGVLTIALVLCLVHALAYVIIGSTVSATGADYVFSSRVLNPALSFAASWTLVLFSGVVAGGLVAWVPKSALPALLRPFARIFGDYRYEVIADYCSSTSGSLVIGGVIIAIVTLTVLRSNAFIQRMLAAGFVFGLLAWIVIYFSLLSTHSPADFANSWNKFMGKTGAFGEFSQRISLAHSAGMTTTHSVTTMTLAGLIMGFWIFYGYYIPSFFSEEVKKPARSLLISSWGSLIFSYIIFVVAAILLQRLVSLDWIAAEGYLFNNPDLVKKAAGGATVVPMPWITFYAAILRPQPILISLVAFGWIFTLLNLVQTYFFYSSRIIYSWSLDRVVPDWLLGKKAASPRPSRSILMMAVLAAIGLIDASTGGPLGTQLTFVFFAVVTQLVPVTALTFLPKLSPEVFALVPPSFRTRVLGVPLSSLIGGLALCYLLWMIVASFLYPAVGVAKPLATVTLLIFLVGSGLLMFFFMRAWRRRHGIDLNAAYRSLSTSEEGPEFE